MQLRLKNLREVRLFALVISGICVCGTLLLSHLLFPHHIMDVILFEATVIAVMLAGPISYYVGLNLLEVSNLSAELEYAVNHDALTGTVTRTRFHRILETLPDDVAILAVADIDHFKRVNDEHGHKAGDIALKRFAQTLMDNCREHDVVARFGGEEFCLLLRGLSLQEGVTVVERLREDVEKKRVHIGDKELNITASFGVVAFCPQDGIGDAFEHADLAVYRAKREGRNRVCVFDPVLDATSADPSEAA